MSSQSILISEGLTPGRLEYTDYNVNASPT